MTSQSSVIPGGEFNKYLHFRRLELYARPPRRARLRAAFRAAAERSFLLLVNAPRLAAVERSALDRKHYFMIGGSPAPPYWPMRRLESCSKG